MANMIIKLGYGLSVGVVSSVILFKRRTFFVGLLQRFEFSKMANVDIGTWPIGISIGFALGYAFNQCQESLATERRRDAIQLN